MGEEDVIVILTVICGLRERAMSPFRARVHLLYTGSLRVPKERVE